MKKNPKTIHFDGTEIFFKLSRYRNNGVLAIIAYETETYGCPYECGVITTNLDDFVFGANMTYVDENNYNGIAQILVDNNIAKYTGYIAQSGYCQYPLLEFDFEELDKYCMQIDEDDLDMEDFVQKLCKEFMGNFDDDEEAENRAEGPDEEDDNFSFEAFLREIEEEDF